MHLYYPRSKYQEKRDEMKPSKNRENGRHCMHAVQLGLNTNHKYRHGLDWMPMYNDEGGFQLSRLLRVWPYRFLQDSRYGVPRGERQHIKGCVILRSMDGWE